MEIQEMGNNAHEKNGELTFADSRGRVLLYFLIN